MLMLSTPLRRPVVEGLADTTTEHDVSRAYVGAVEAAALRATTRESVDGG